MLSDADGQLKALKHSDASDQLMHEDWVGLYPKIHGLNQDSVDQDPWAQLRSPKMDMIRQG